MEVHFYFDKTVKESEYVLYNDDGKTPDAFEQTLFEEIEFESEFKKNSLAIEIEPDFGVKFAPYNKQISLVIHHLKSQPKKLKINGKKVKFEWEENFKEVFILPIVLKEDEVKINISF